MARRVGGVAIIDLLELYDSGALKPNASQIKRLDFNRSDLSDGVALPQRWIRNRYVYLDHPAQQLSATGPFTLRAGKIR